MFCISPSRANRISGLHELKLPVLMLALLPTLLTIGSALAESPKIKGTPLASLGTGLYRDIEFAKVGDVSLTLDAYIPPGDGPFPTCILVHGGGFTKGDKTTYITPIFKPLGDAGFAWFTINYRLAPQHRWPACADDVETAIRWVKQHALVYKVDVHKIAIIGESAGGHLVSYIGARGKGETRVAAVVPFYAPHDLEAHVRGKMKLESMEALLGLTELNDASYKKIREISVNNYIVAGMPPFLLIHGDKDAVVLPDQSKDFQTKMKAAGNTCDLILVPGGGHGMGGWDKLGSDYQKQMIDWLKKTLK